MTASKKLIQAAAGASGGDFYPTTLDQSLRMDGSTSFSRTFGTPTNASKWSCYFIVKRSALSSDFFLQGNTFSVSNNFSTAFDSLDRFYWSFNNSTYMISTSKYRDPSAWYHILLVWDSANATAAHRARVYINGTEITDWVVDHRSSVSTSLNAWHIQNTTVFSTALLAGSATAPAVAYQWNGYCALVVDVDGQALTPSDFGEFKNGVWVYTGYTGSYGNQGFLLDFSNSSSFGADSSGNGNNWSVNGTLTSSDQMIDTPTNNFCTLNPLYEGYGSYTAAPFTLSEGNLQGAGNSTANNCAGTMAIAGKNYFESTWTVTGNGQAIIGIMNTSGQTVVLDGYYNAVFVLGTNVQSMTFNTNDTIGVATDVDGGTVKFYRNGTLGYTASVTLTDDDWFPWVYGALNSTSVVNFGQSSFAYTPPTGYETLSTANLPEPAIGPNSATQSDENFNTVLYTGNGSTQSVTGVNFQPDFTWIKDRDAAYGHQLYDVLRGAENTLRSDSAVAEYNQGAQYGALTSFDSDGFSVDVGSDVDVVNTTGNDYVSWNWKANGSGVSNTDGTVTSTVSANTNAGFSIATFNAGTGTTDKTYGHGLGTTPAFVLMKARTTTATQWWVWHKSFSNPNNYLYLQETFALLGPDANVWGNSGFTSTTCGFRSNYTFVVSDDVVTYNFAEVEGFSKFGSYTGNGSATEGPFIYCGFRPAWIMIKEISNADDWMITDADVNSYNPAYYQLKANTSGAEVGNTSYSKLDFVSNGFKIRTNPVDGALNTSGSNYIYMAFAEMPFKYSVGR